MGELGDVFVDVKMKSLTTNVGRAKPVTARILLSTNELGIVQPDTKCRINIANITNISETNIPDSILMFVEDAISITYNENGTPKQVFVCGPANKINQISVLLYKLAINTTGVCIHPFKRGGRITNTSGTQVEIRVTETGLKLVNGGDIMLSPKRVIGADQTVRKINDEMKPAAVINQYRDNTVISTIVSMPDKTRLNILTEYITTEYQRVKQNIKDVEITPMEEQVLLSVYPTVSDYSTDTASVMQSVSSDMLTPLIEKGLIHNNDQVEMTHRGFAAVDEHLEDITYPGDPVWGTDPVTGDETVSETDIDDVLYSEINE